MGLPTSGNPIPLADVNSALQRNVSSSLQFNDSELRAVAGVPTSGSQFSISSVYNKITGSIRVVGAYNPGGAGAYGWSGGTYGAGGAYPYWGVAGADYYFVTQCYWVGAPSNYIAITYADKTAAQVVNRNGGVRIKDVNFNTIATYSGGTWSDEGGKAKVIYSGVTSNPFPNGVVRWVAPSN